MSSRPEKGKMDGKDAQSPPVTSRPLLTPKSRISKPSAGDPTPPLNLPTPRFIFSSEAGPDFKRPPSAQSSVFNFAEMSSPVSTNASPAPRLQFGSLEPGNGTGDAPFTFRSLYNVTPSPSPKPSPRTAPTQLPLDFDFSKLALNESSPTRPRTNQLAWHAKNLPELGSHARKSSQVEYDVLDEQLPAHPVFTELFQSALKSGVNVARTLANTLKSMNYSTRQDDDISRFLRDAEDYSTFRGSDTRTIAVLGDSGQGKSSLINSLLHVPNIAKTGDIGSACTSVVTEYRQKEKKHDAPITIEVEYLSQSEIDEMIKELLWSYRQLFLPGVESDTTSENDYARYMRESDQAWSALEAAFKHRREFQKHMLQDMSEGALERLQEQLIRWTHDIKWPSGDSAGFWKSTATTADECCEKVDVFMQDQYWPFTKIIRVYLNAKILKTGLVLADLPGLQDTNLARVRATQSYLVQCNNILLVTNISRAITDQSLKSSLYQVLSRHVPLAWEDTGGKGMNIAVVCTKSEDINLKTSKAEFCGPKQLIDKKVMDLLETDLQDAKRSGDAARKKQIKQQQLTLLMNARNQHVKRGLRTAYASKVPKGTLEVFCVSNVMYEKYSRKRNLKLVRASCIPELRQFCYTITADAQFREALDFLRSKLPSLLHSIELWASSGNVSQETEAVIDESILEILDGVVDEITTASTELENEFNHCFEEQIIQFLDKRCQEWEKVAIREGSRWMDWHWSKPSLSKNHREDHAEELVKTAQYYAFCLNNGHHATPKRDREDWNAKIIWKMRMELEYQWDLVEDEIPTVFQSLLDTVKSELVYLIDEIRVTSSSHVCDTLIEGIEARLKGIEYKLELAREKFSSEISLIRRNASESNYNSFILKEMIPTYRSASSQRGTGRDSRQKRIVQGRIEGGTIFPNISFMIAQDVKNAANATKNHLVKVLTKELVLAKTDVNLAIASQQKTVSEDTSRKEQMAVKQRLGEDIKELKEKQFGVLESISSLA